MSLERAPLTPPSRGAWAHGVALVAVAALPVVVWPGLGSPFSTPKVVWLVAGAASVFVLTRRAVAVTLPRPFAWLAAAWTATFIVAAATADLPAFDATLLGLASVALVAGVVRSGIPLTQVAFAQVAGATVVALVALCQWAGTDPFAWLGWQAPIAGASVRMRVYATLGNPNFVGALMAMSVGLAGAVALDATRVPVRVVALSAAALQAAALLATGSRGAALGLGLGAMAWAAVRWSGRAIAALLAVVGFGAIVIALSPARPLDTTIAGRVYLWRVVAPHATQYLATGLGPGALELRFPQWQREAAARGLRDERFLGLADHVHNDYLEALVERGIGGLATVLAVLACGWRAARARVRPVPPLVAASLAALVAGGACAFVDYPLARPVEVTWWWLALAMILVASPSGRRRDGATGQAP